MISNKEFDEVFSLLKNVNPRYYIQTGNIGETIGNFHLYLGRYYKSEVFNTDISEKLDRIISQLAKKKSLLKVTDTYLNLLSDELEKALISFELVELRNEKFYFQQTTLIILIGQPNNSQYSIETIPDQFFKELVSFSQTKYDLLTKFFNALQQLINPNKSKLILKLPASDIVLLFKLLDTENLIANENKTDIIRFISNSFETTRSEKITESYVKKLFYNTESSTIKNIQGLLSRFRRRLLGI